VGDVNVAPRGERETSRWAVMFEVVARLAIKREKAAIRR
jgi:hypothetical protein